MDPYTFLMRTRVIFIILLIAALPVLAYGLTQGLSSVFEGDGNSNWLYFVVAASITLLWLGVGYAVLKLGFFAAHTQNPDEPMIELKDIPKDIDQLARTNAKR